MAIGGIVAVELSALGSNQGQPGAPGGRRQLHRGKNSRSAVPPFVRPIASEYPPILGIHGVPKSRDRGDDTENIEPERSKGKIGSILCYIAPQGRLSGAGEGFHLWFPAPSVGFILHTPSPS